jgi:hypothetical protein
MLSLRCAVLADNGPAADLRIYKQDAPGQTLPQLVQVKTGMLAGTLASGLLTTAYCTLKSGDWASAVQNVAGRVVVCTAGAMAAQKLLCPAIAAASGSAAGVLCALTVSESALTARHVGDQLVGKCTGL